MSKLFVEIQIFQSNPNLPVKSLPMFEAKNHIIENDIHIFEVNNYTKLYYPISKVMVKVTREVTTSSDTTT